MKGKRFGLIGYPLRHSLSEKFFNDKFIKEELPGYTYATYEITDIEEVKSLLTMPICGLNVTIPYKEAVIPFIDELDDTAKAVGAVNCIRIAGGNTKGYNTDVIGFRTSLLNFIGSQRPRALILGTGGASKAAAYVLDTNGMEYLCVSRSSAKGDVTYKDLNKDIMSTHKLIINTTPAGMYPNTDTFPELPYELITGEHYLFDMVYNPEETYFLQAGKRQGASICSGKEMFISQAEASWEIWQGLRR